MQDHVGQSHATNNTDAERDAHPFIELGLFSGVWCVHWSNRVNRLTVIQRGAILDQNRDLVTSFSP